MSLIIFLIYTISFIWNALGLTNSNDINIFIALLFIFFGTISIRKINLPSTLILLVSFFLISTLISDCLSVNIPNSISYSIYYLGAFFAFTYANHNKQTLSKILLPMVLAASVMLAIYSTLLPSLTKSLNILVPQSGYQLVFPSFGSHNHLGDFLLISLVTCFYFLITKGGPRILYIHNKPILIYLLIIFLTPYFIFSYSRSAYVSLALTLIMMFIYFAKEKYFKTSTTVFGLIVLIITLCSGFLFLVSNTSIKPLMTKNINNDLSKNHNLTQKYPSGNRQQYLYQGISSLRESPLGVGAGNFVYASKKYKGSIEWWTETSHNIFVDVFVENGLISGFLFLIIISILFLKSNKDAYFFVALALLINFQSDYTYRIYPIFLLFCMFIGLAYRGNIKSRFDKTKNKFQPSI